MPEKVVKPMDRPCQTCKGSGKVSVLVRGETKMVTCPACNGKKVGGSGLMTK